jgi:hypothetical protein
MIIKISSVVLYGDSQPDFNKLLTKGWVHPLGIRDLLLERSLVKEFGSLQFQIVKHEFMSNNRRALYKTYTEVYVHHASDDEILLKGHGTPFSISELFAEHRGNKTLGELSHGK